MALSGNDIVRATLTWLDFNNQKQQNVFHYRLAGVGNADNADVFSAVSGNLSNVYNNWLLKLSVDYTTYNLLVDEVNPNVGPWEVIQNVGDAQLVSGALTGEDGTNAPMPPGDCIMMKLGTLLRKHQGRKYFGGFCENSNISTGRVDPATTSAVAGGWFDLVTATPVPNSALALEAVVPNMAGFATNQIITGIVQAIWRSQRRRQPFVGI